MVKLQFFCTQSISGLFINTYQYRACSFSVQRLHKYQTPPSCITFSIGLKFLLFIKFYYGQVTIFRTPSILGQFVKLSFDTEDITSGVRIEIKFQFPHPVSSTSEWLSKISFFSFMVKLRILSYPTYRGLIS